MNTATYTTIAALKESGQDFEWYPTTPEMINVVMGKLYKDAESILDIGAGDGRTLIRFAEKCTDAKLYAIEKSSVMIQKQPKEIIPIGTEFFEQNLAAVPVDYIFSNPPFRQFEDWTRKIIVEGYAKRAYLVLPHRWNESQIIADALKQRGATAHTVYAGDFSQGDRPSRAVVDIVEISYPTDGRGNVQDPFGIWFDQNVDTFDHAEEFKESDPGRDVARRFANASIPEMVEAYLAEYQLLETNYRAIFKLDYALLRELGVNKDAVRDGLKKKIADLKLKYWNLLFDRLDAITSRLTTKSKKTLMDQLTANRSVEFTAANAYAVVLWAIKNANQYFDDQLIQLFQDLSTFDGVLNYKSNQRTWKKDGWRYGRRDEDFTHYALDYRIVVQKYRAMKNEPYSDYEYPGELHKNCHEIIADVIAVLSNLGFSTYSPHSQDRGWTGGQWENWYTNDENILFQVKAYKNGNLHLRFMPAAMMALNIEAGRLLKWVRTESDVVQEMGYIPAEVKKYFNHNAQIAAGSLPLLAGAN